MDVVVSGQVDLPEPAVGEHWVVGALITDGHGRVFVQRRSMNRRLFPGCWDIVGGHVEPGETLLEALAREVKEETGWQLITVDAVAGRFDWHGPDGHLRHEFDVVATASGDLSRPTLERDKHPEFRWITENDLPVLLENRDVGDTAIHDLIARHFDVGS